MPCHRYILLVLSSVLCTFKGSDVCAQGADSLRMMLRQADSIDELIPIYLEGNDFTGADEQLQLLEDRVFMLKRSWSFLAQNMAYRKKVDQLGQHVETYRTALYELSMEQDSSSSLVLVNENVERSARKAPLWGRQLFELMRDTMLLNERLRRMEYRNMELMAANQELSHKLRKYEQGVFGGLSFGFNFFFNQARQYYVQSDSTLGVYGKSKGMSFIISGVLGYKINERHSILFNVPLQDFTGDSQTAIGLFNQRMAGGLGYGLNLQQLSFIAILNISPYDKVETELLKEHKFADDAVMQKLALEKLPTTQAYSPSFTIGVSYNFIERMR